jgi:hypothetical protein
MYNEEKHRVESLLHPGHVFYEGGNGNLIVLKETSPWINNDGND